MLDYEAIPGTIPLVDSSQSDIVLHPTPSCHPDDPLNWSYRRKLLSMFCMVTYTVAVAVPSASIYSVLTPISHSTGLPLATLNQGTGYMFLFFGLGCIISQPLSQQFGKRPVYLVSVLGTALIQLWAPNVTSSGQWIGSKIVQGFLGASVESLGEVTVADVWFEHERGRWMGVYGFALMFASNIAPVVAGFITQGMNWKWVLYWGVIFDGVAFVFLFFFFEETNFPRAKYMPSVEETSETEQASFTEKSPAYDDENEPTFENDSHSSMPRDSDKPRDMDLENTAPSGIVYEKKTFVQKLALLDEPKPMMLWTMIKRPFIIFVRFPVIVYSGFLCGTGLICFNICNATTSYVLSNPPYNFKASMVGLCYISPCVIVFLASFYGGYMSDLLRMKLAKRNGGISEPEHRLWVLLAYLILCPPALILWGIGAAEGIHWFPIVLGMGLVKGLGTLTSICALNYAVDSYREIASDSMVVVILIRNLMSFGLSYGITPWFMNEGLKKCFGEAAGVSFGCCVTMFIFIKWGKQMRNSSKKIYWRFVQESIDNGVSH
ncbi:YALIA101S01e15324g1_1 [Yarrowia lipolytica]|nr:Putative MFS-type transporter [Yarrowia lipolytica]SEI31116.1 YALIA101S01e15324g1_1 [Yarrowia lipolytica]VBB85451.1 Conserved hypothetical protein [Yarrowia lipolytica]